MASRWVYFQHNRTGEVFAAIGAIPNYEFWVGPIHPNDINKTNERARYIDYERHYDRSLLDDPETFYCTAPYEE